MADILSFYLPQQAAAQKGSTGRQAMSGRITPQSDPFAAAFFAMLEGAVSARAESGNNGTSDGSMFSRPDGQGKAMDALSQLMDQIEIGDNGQIISYHHEGTKDTLESLPLDADTIEQALAALEARFNGTDTTTNATTTQDATNSDAYQALNDVLAQFLSGLPQENKPTGLLLTPSDGSANGSTLTATNADSDSTAKGKEALVATGLGIQDIMDLLRNAAAYLRSQENSVGSADGAASDSALNKDKTGKQDPNLAAAGILPHVMLVLVNTTSGTDSASTDEQSIIFLPRGFMASGPAKNGQPQQNTPASGSANGDVNADGDANATAQAAAQAAADKQALTRASMNPFLSDSQDSTLIDGGKGKKDGHSPFSRAMDLFGSQSGQNSNSEATAAHTRIDNSPKAAAQGATLPANAMAAMNAQAALSANGRALSAESFDALTGLDPSSHYGSDTTATAAAGMPSPLYNGQNLLQTTAASLMNQSNTAAQPHPATQMVAASFAKNAQGDTKSITLRLDPPELGKVHVKIDFSDDNGARAVISSEKPHTHAMLQRDAHILHRALQDAGMDLSDGGLDFQLSQDGNFSGQNDRENAKSGAIQGASSGFGESVFGSDESGTIIEATMDWNVDEKTGLTHYNLVV